MHPDARARRRIARPYTRTVVEGRTRVGINALAVAALLCSLGSGGVLQLAGWPGLLVLALGLLGATIAVIVRQGPPALRWYAFPKALLALVLWGFIAIPWAAQPGAAAVAAGAQLLGAAVSAYLAFVTSWHELLRALGRALRYLLAASIVFELVVACFVRSPLAPLWPVPEGSAPAADAPWSADLLFSGGPIQGIAGDSGILGFHALLGLIVFGVEFAGRSVRRPFAAAWFLVAAAVLALARPEAGLIALVAAAVGFCLVLWGRSIREERRRPLYAMAALAAAAGIALAILVRAPLLGSGAWLQFGVVGTVLLGLLAVTTLARAWFRAVDRPRRSGQEFLPYGMSTVAPLLITVAVLVESLGEAALLPSAAWVLFAALATKLKVDAEVPSLEGDVPVASWRETPIRSAPRRAAPRPEHRADRR